MRDFAMIAILLCVLVTGCDRKSNDVTDVFYRYFHAPLPTNATILNASNSESYSVGLDQWDFFLEAELPREFIETNLPLTVGNSGLATNHIEPLFGVDDVKSGVTDALEDRPSWFEPSDMTDYVVATNDMRLSFVSGYAVVTFADTAVPNRFQLWISDHGWSRLFIDRQTGHVYARHKFP